MQPTLLFLTIRFCAQHYEQRADVHGLDDRVDPVLAVDELGVAGIADICTHAALLQSILRE